MKVFGLLEISRMFDFVWNRFFSAWISLWDSHSYGITVTLPPLISYKVHCLIHSLGACRFCTLNQHGYLNDLFP